MNHYGPIEFAPLRSAQGVSIQVSYLPRSKQQGDMSLYWAEDLSVRVCGLDLKHAKITAVFVNRYFVNGVLNGTNTHRATLHRVLEGPLLTAYEGLMVAVAPDCCQVLPNNHLVVCRPQIAVVIDGVWQTDPVQWGDMHNFNFSWTLAADPRDPDRLWA